MHYKTIKLDRRHAWHQDFVHMIEFEKRGFFQGKLVNNSGVLEFDRGRRWFNNTFGWSQDVDTRSAMILSGSVKPTLFSMEDINPLWAYGVKYNDYRIYVATDKELNWFMLSHPRTV